MLWGQLSVTGQHIVITPQINSAIQNQRGQLGVNIIVAWPDT
jgi:hypothetical protein